MINGKASTLEHIAQALPKTPIPPFHRISQGSISPVAEARRAAQELGFPRQPVIIRSDGQEDGLGKSFAGLYQTCSVEAPAQFEEALHQVREGYLEGVNENQSLNKRMQMELYAESRGAEMPNGPIDVFVQRFVPAPLRAQLTRSPASDRFYLDVSWNLHQRVPDSQGFFGKREELFEKVEEDAHFLEELPDQTFSTLANTIAHVLHDYESVEQLPEMRTDVVYQMELTLEPYSFLQWRPFRKKEHADFRIEDREAVAWPAFGVTPPEGYEIPLARLNLSPFGDDLRQPSFMGKILTMNNFVEQVTQLCEEHDCYMDSVGVLLPQGRSLSAAYDGGFFRKLPAVTIIGGGTSRQYPWQAHEEFRLLERDGIFVYLNMASEQFLQMYRSSSPRAYVCSDGERATIVPY